MRMLRPSRNGCPPVVNKSKIKGTQAESDFVRYCRVVQKLPHVERRTLAGANDRGDIAGVPGVVFELKAAVKHEIPKWKQELLKEIENDHAQLGALVVKVPRKSVGSWDAWVPAWMLDWGSDEFSEDLEQNYRNGDVWFRMSVQELFMVLRQEGYIK